jgi:deazaflavin-dependent oxidoreductase (nitroreductase family)
MPLSYPDAGPVRRAIRQLVTTRPVAAASSRLLPPLDRVALRLTRGRGTLSAWVTGLPVVQLTTTGARTGLPRTTGVLGIPDGDGLLVVAANFGSRAHPAWYRNLQRHPEARVSRGGRLQDVRATELVGAERDAAFEAALRLNPGWSRYRERAAGRVIGVLRLSPR